MTTTSQVIVCVYAEEREIALVGEGVSVSGFRGRGRRIEVVMRLNICSSSSVVREPQAASTTAGGNGGREQERKERETHRDLRVIVHRVFQKCLLRLIMSIANQFEVGETSHFCRTAHSSNRRSSSGRMVRKNTASFVD